MKTLSDRIRTLEPIEYDETEEANPKDYIAAFRQLLARAASSGILTLLVVVYCRVSSGKQRRRGNLDHQLSKAVHRLFELGPKYGVSIQIVGVFPEDVSGWKLSKRERPQLAEAAKLAKQHDALLVALNTSRFVRNESGSLPTVGNFDKLMRLVGKVRLATILHPRHHEDRSADTKRGFEARNSKPGRPKRRAYTKYADLSKLSKRRMHRWRAKGWTIRRIAKRLGLKPSSVDYWLKRKDPPLSNVRELEHKKRAV